ncbi:MAG: YbaN family protein [Hyphomicrobiales bacterium]
MAAQAIKRGFFIGLGSVFFAAGVAGMFLPVVPTVPFMLLALWAFSRGSERLHQWVLHHPRFGRAAREWHQHRAIPMRAKLTAVTVMAASAVYLVGFSSAPLLAIVAALALMAYGAWYILTRPTLDPAMIRQDGDAANPSDG